MSNILSRSTSQKDPLIVFSKYACYNVGGAEKSNLALASQYSIDQDVKVTLYSIDKPFYRNKKLSLLTVPDSFSKHFYSLRFSVPLLPYLEYCLNRTSVRLLITSLPPCNLWTYGIYSPIAAISFNGTPTIFIRSETDLAIRKNYFSSVKRLLKYFLLMLETPFYLIYKSDLQKSFQKSRVIVNSLYMQKRLLELHGIQSDVIYPNVDIAHLRQQLSQTIQTRRWIMAVADSRLKGLHIVIGLARMFPGLSFKIVTRNIQSGYWDNNIYWQPWTSDLSCLYTDVRLVLVPSQWEEAFGRVARESFLLDIPVLVSGIGGLPEAVNFRQDSIINDYSTVDSWADALSAILDA